MVVQHSMPIRWSPPICPYAGALNLNCMMASPHRDLLIIGIPAQRQMQIHVQNRQCTCTRTSPQSIASAPCLFAKQISLHAGAGSQPHTHTSELISGASPLPNISRAMSAERHRATHALRHVSAWCIHEAIGSIIGDNSRMMHQRGRVRACICVNSYVWHIYRLRESRMQPREELRTEERTARRRGRRSLAAPPPSLDARYGRRGTIVSEDRSVWVARE
jgi:hypothetical protein